MFRIVPSSTRARHIGSQCSPWKLGRPSVAGFSVKVSEWQPFAATRRISSALSLGVPQHGNRHRDEAPGIGAAPLVDVPVVVGPHDREGQVLVLGGQEEPAGERRERREAHGRQDPAGAHVLHPLVDVEAARAHLVEGGGVDAVLLLGPTGDGVEADVGDHRPRRRSRRRRPRRCGRPCGARSAYGRRHPALEEVGRLDHVVVHAHEDQVVEHLRTPVPGDESRFRI